MPVKCTDYNCMGYALNIKDWLIPIGWRKKCIDTMVLSLTQGQVLCNWGKDSGYGPKLKLVQKKDMVLGKEYVAFRVCNSKNDDFHFMKRGKLGHWRHKNGGARIKSISQKNVFSATWKTNWYSYDGKIYLFEVL